MNNIDWRRKLGSRKFWAMVAEFVVGVYVFAGGSQDSATQIAGIIASFGAVAVYILAEAMTDTAYAGQHEKKEDDT